MMPVQAKLHGRRDMRAVGSVDDVVTSIKSWPRLDTRVGAMLHHDAPVCITASVLRNIVLSYM